MTEQREVYEIYTKFKVKLCEANKVWKGGRRLAKVNVHTKRGTRPQITRLGFRVVSRLRLGEKKKREECVF